MPDASESLVAQIEAAGAKALEEIESCGDAAALEPWRVLHMGRKSALTALQKSFKDVPAEDRRQVGQVLNRVKNEMREAFDRRLEQSRDDEQERQLEHDKIDTSLPGRPIPRGHLHPITRVMQEMEDIFVSMGFDVASGPDIEEEFYNFEALNIAPDHPARDMHDTFYMTGGGVLRTHTSPVQIRTMLSHPPPLAIIAPGRVYRCDSDTTHSPMFHLNASLR